MEDSLGYYGVDITEYGSSDVSVDEEDRIRGGDLHFFANKFRDNDEQCELTYQFVKTHLLEVNGTIYNSNCPE